MPESHPLKEFIKTPERPLEAALKETRRGVRRRTLLTVHPDFLLSVLTELLEYRAMKEYALTPAVALTVEPGEPEEK